MHKNWVKRSMRQVFKKHKKFLDSVRFRSDLTSNTTRYIPASGEVIESETFVDVPALTRNYTRVEADGELVRASDIEVTILIEDLSNANITPKINDTVVFRNSNWSIQSISLDQLQTLSIIQLRSTNG